MVSKSLQRAAFESSEVCLWMKVPCINPPCEVRLRHLNASPSEVRARSAVFRCWRRVPEEGQGCTMHISPWRELELTRALRGESGASRLRQHDAQGSSAAGQAGIPQQAPWSRQPPRGAALTHPSAELQGPAVHALPALRAPPSHQRARGLSQTLREGGGALLVGGQPSTPLARAGSASVAAGSSSGARRRAGSPDTTRSAPARAGAAAARVGTGRRPGPRPLPPVPSLAGSLPQWATHAAFAMTAASRLPRVPTGHRSMQAQGTRVQPRAYALEQAADAQRPGQADPHPAGSGALAQRHARAVKPSAALQQVRRRAALYGGRAVGAAGSAGGGASTAPPPDEPAGNPDLLRALAEQAAEQRALREELAAQAATQAALQARLDALLSLQAPAPTPAPAAAVVPPAPAPAEATPDSPAPPGEAGGGQPGAVDAALSVLRLGPRTGPPGGQSPGSSSGRESPGEGELDALLAWATDL